MLSGLGARRLKATYDFTIHTHGSVELSCAVAEVKDGAVTCSTALHATHNLAKQLALMTKLPLEKVRCVHVEGSGCYGSYGCHGHEDATGEA